MWDALGVEPVALRLQKEGHAVPRLVDEILASPAKRFYSREDGRLTYFDFAAHQQSPVTYPPGIFFLVDLKEQGRLVKKNAGASLVDLGDGVLCVEFHSKMNSIGEDTIQMVYEGLRVSGQDFCGLVIGNQGLNFSVGANLMLILLEAQEQNWEEIDQMIRSFQRVNMALKYSDQPVVVAPFGMTLGGGCEICLHASQVQASVETYMGLVELGVGLIPAGGGTKEMLLRSLAGSGRDLENDFFPQLRQAFETIALGKVSNSADEARALGFLRERDGVSLNRDRQLQDAKECVLRMAASGYRKLGPPSSVVALGNRALAPLKISMHQMKRGGYISDYDLLLGSKLGMILCGGNCNNIQKVSEQYILDMERETFLSLCGERNTLERIRHMLEKGRPLRN